MELITFESEAYKKLAEKIDKIADSINNDDLSGKIDKIADYVVNANNFSEDKEEIWLDSHEVVEILKISVRTLQRLRTDNQIPYFMLRGRCRYRLSDIQKALENKIISAHPKTLEELHQNYLKLKSR